MLLLLCRHKIPIIGLKLWHFEKSDFEFENIFKFIGLITIETIFQKNI